MKADKLLEELSELAKRLGYSVRRETGTFRGGACLVHDRKLILINKSMPVEAAGVILARALSRLPMDHEFMKPAVREIIDRERAWVDHHPDVVFSLVPPSPLPEDSQETAVSQDPTQP